MADAKKDYVDEFLENEGVRGDNFSEDTQPTAGFEMIAFPLNVDTADVLTEVDLIDDEPAAINDHLFHKLALGGHDGTQPLGNAYNAGLILQADHRLAGLLGYDEFRQQTVVLRSLDTGVDAVPSVKVRKGGEPLQSHHLDALMAFMQAPSEVRGEIGGHGCGVTKQALEAGISNAARQNAFNPVHRLIEAQEWDGIPRLADWLHRYLGCPDDVYHREVGIKWMVGAVGRAYEPGTKFDFVLTVVGPQGVRKSTMFEVLGGEFFSTLGNGAMKDEKKLVEATQGSWIVEIAEMAAMQGSSNEGVKSLISTTVDKARLAYDKLTTECRRSFVFGATTNNSGALEDPTGGRRYWMVDVEVRSIDTDALALEVPQMWAEAAHIYREMRAYKSEGSLPLALSDEAEAVADRKQQAALAYDDIDALADDIRQVVETPRMDGDGQAFGYGYYTEYAPKELFAAITGRQMSEYSSGKVARDFLKACRRIEYLKASGERRYIKRIREKGKSVIVDREKFLESFAARLREVEGADLSAFDDSGNARAEVLGDMTTL